MSDKEFLMRLVFDPRGGLKRFFNEVILLFNPTRGSNTSRITNSLSLFSLIHHTLNLQNWRLFCVLQCPIIIRGSGQKSGSGQSIFPFFTY